MLESVDIKQAREMGKVLISIKEKCKHGEWQQKLAEDKRYLANYSYRRLMDYIDIAKYWELLEKEFGEVVNCSINAALKVIRGRRVKKIAKTVEEAIERGREILAGSKEYIGYCAKTVRKYIKLAKLAVSSSSIFQVKEEDEDEWGVSKEMAVELASYKRYTSSVEEYVAQEEAMAAVSAYEDQQTKASRQYHIEDTAAMLCHIWRADLKQPEPLDESAVISYLTSNWKGQDLGSKTEVAVTYLKNIGCNVNEVKPLVESYLLESEANN